MKALALSTRGIVHSMTRLSRSMLMTTNPDACHSCS
jgi:hypothetical protein